MGTGKYNFESWKKNEEVYPPEVGATVSECIPLHLILRTDAWLKELVKGKYIDKTELELIRSRQSEVIKTYLNQRLNYGKSIINKELQKTTRRLTFLEDHFAHLDGEIQIFRKDKPFITKYASYRDDVYFETVSKLIDPDLFNILQDNLSRSATLQPILKYGDPYDTNPSGGDAYKRTIIRDRERLELHCKYKIYIDIKSFLEKLLQEEQKRSKGNRGRKETKIIPDDAFYNKAKELRQEMGSDALSQKHAENPSGPLIHELLVYNFKGYAIEDTNKQKPLEINKSTARARLIENRDKWLY